MTRRYTSRLYKKKAVPIKAPPRGAKFVYLVANRKIFLRDLRKSSMDATNLILNGIKGVSMSPNIINTFSGIQITMPFRDFLKLNNVEKIDYTNYNDLLKSEAKFLNRLEHGDMASGDISTIRSILNEIIDNLSLQRDVGKDIHIPFPDLYHSSYKNIKILKDMLVGTTFDSINELVWFTLMFLERAWKGWDLIDNKIIDKLESRLRKELKDYIKMVSSSFDHEEELVLLDHRLVIPNGTTIDDLDISSERDNRRLEEKLKKFGITYYD